MKKGFFALLLLAVLILGSAAAEKNPPARSTDWNIQILVFKNASVNGWSHSFSYAQVSHIQRTCGKLPETIEHLSGGRMHVKNLYFTVTEEPLTSLSDAWYLSPTYGPGKDVDISGYIAGKNIHLIAVFSPIGDYPRPAERGWLGLGGNYTIIGGDIVYTVSICDDLVYPINTWTDNGYTYACEINVLTHEILHAVETNSSLNGWNGFQGLHDGEENGYEDHDTGWLEWQRDLMQDTIKTGKAGFRPESFYVRH